MNQLVRAWRRRVPQQFDAIARNFTRSNNGDSTDNNGSSNKSKSITVTDIPDNEIRKSVYVSQSHDIFTNLAFEDWLYNNYDFTRHHILMLWTNDPCVVIGRHQNPFAEANTSRLDALGIALARRNSGGGTVYHDRQNVNLTFFTPKERHNRKYNLQIIKRALHRQFQINAEISARDDLTVDGYKVSGTAAKLGNPNAYHHCTLLVNSNKQTLRDALVKYDTEIESRATASIPSPVKNLADTNNQVNVSDLKAAIGVEFLRTSPTNADVVCDDGILESGKFHWIDPTEELYPGLEGLRANFASWDWRIGRTPKFNVTKHLQLKYGEHVQNVELKVAVDAGIIQSILLVLPNCNTTIPIVSVFGDQPYSEDSLACIEAGVKDICIDSVKSAIDHDL